jgi:hypothetical protein
MSTLRLWAIGIDEVRGIFGADPETANRLREAATTRFGASTKPPAGLLGKLGPFLRGGGDPAAPRPGVPSTDDIDDVLSGRYMSPQRLVPAWNLLEFWLDTLALGFGEWPLTEPGLNDFDFDLARAEVPARYGLSDLFKSGLGISLTRCPGMAVGWVPRQHVLGMVESWPAGIAELTPEHQELAGGILRFLNSSGEWNEQDRAEVDLVAIFRA